MSDAVKAFPDRVYVPNSGDNAVDVIDPHTFTIIDHFAVGMQPQHVVPSYDLKTLWVVNDLDDSLTRIDPATGRKLGTVKVEDPYNLYYTPDGRHAIVVAERLRRRFHGLTLNRPRRRIPKHPNLDHLRDCFLQCLQPFLAEIGKVEKYASDIAPGPHDARSKTAGDRITLQIAGHDGNGGAGRPRRAHGRRADRGDQVDPAGDEIGRHRRQWRHISTGDPRDDADLIGSNAARLQPA